MSHEDQVAEALERRAAIDDDAVLCCFDAIACFGGDVDTVVALSETFFPEARDDLPLQRSEEVFARALRSFCQFLFFCGFFGGSLCARGCGGLTLGLGLGLGLACASLNDEQLSDIEFVGVLDTICLFQAFYGGGVFSSDAVEGFAFFDDVSRFACRKVSCGGYREFLSDSEKVRVGNAVEARKFREGDAVASRDGEKRFAFSNTMYCCASRRLRRCLLRLCRDGGRLGSLGLVIAADDIGIARHDSAHGGNAGVARQLVSFDAFVGGDRTKANLSSLLARGKKKRCQKDSGEKQGKGRTEHALYCNGAMVSRQAVRQEARQMLCLFSA